MKFSKEQLWHRFQKFYADYPDLGLAVDLSRMNFGEDFFASIEPRLQAALAGMKALEAGAIANPDEKRMVGHYWLRNSSLAPTPEIAQLRRGDLLFWKGHVAIVRDPDTVVHAASFHMLVVLEPVADVVRRVMEEGNGPIRAVKRLPPVLTSQ